MQIITKSLNYNISTAQKRRQPSLVGNDTRDDAAVYDMKWNGNHKYYWFFLAYSRRPFHFGRIAATNALSDVCYGRKTINGDCNTGMAIDKQSGGAQVMEAERPADAGIT
jgi:selenophosphate synthase